MSYVVRVIMGITTYLLGFALRQLRYLLGKISLVGKVACTHAERQIS